MNTAAFRKPIIDDWRPSLKPIKLHRQPLADQLGARVPLQRSDGAIDRRKGVAGSLAGIALRERREIVSHDRVREKAASPPLPMRSMSRSIDASVRRISDKIFPGPFLFRGPGMQKRRSLQPACNRGAPRRLAQEQQRRFAKDGDIGRGEGECHPDAAVR